jgi:hypothetical protein
VKVMKIGHGPYFCDHEESTPTKHGYHSRP